MKRHNSRAAKYFKRRLLLTKSIDGWTTNNNPGMFEPGYGGIMKKLIVISLLGLCGLLLAPAGTLATLLSQDAIAAAERFVRIIDSGNSNAAYSQASPLLRLAQDEQEFAIAIERAQKLLGPVQQRQLTALRSIGIYPHFPDGDYLIVQFEAVTQYKSKAVEVILLRNLDDVWLVVDYSIR